MKKLIMFLIIATITCCKKKEVYIEPIKEDCKTKSKVLEGVYKCNTCNYDTIKIEFDRNYCPDNNKNLYYCYGLKKAVQPCLTTHTIVNSSYDVFAIWSNESKKEGVLNGYNSSFVRKENDSVIHIAMPSEGDYYFTKIK